jgi:hypothetical protein
MGDFHGFQVFEVKPKHPGFYTEYLHISRGDPWGNYLAHEAQDAAWLRNFLQTMHGDAMIICDERYHPSTDSAVSIELLDIFHLRVREFRRNNDSIQLNVTVELYNGFYSVQFRCIGIYEILLKLPLSSRGLQDPVMQSFISVCELSDVHLNLQKRAPSKIHDDMPNTPMSELPIWLLRWMRTSRCDQRYITRMNRRVSISLGDTGAKQVLIALLHLDTTKKNNTTQWTQVSFWSADPRQTKLYFDTVLEYNTRFSIFDGIIQYNPWVATLAISPILPTVDHIAQSKTCEKYLMSLVEIYHFPYITPEMICLNDANLDAIIISSVSVIRHFKDTVAGMANQFTDPRAVTHFEDSLQKILQEMSSQYIDAVNNCSNSMVPKPWQPIYDFFMASIRRKSIVQTQV